MGALLARMRALLLGRRDWEPGRVKRVWDEVIVKDDRFFQKVCCAAATRRILPVIISTCPGVRRHVRQEWQHGRRVLA